MNSMVEGSDKRILNKHDSYKWEFTVSRMRKYILQILRLNVYLLINCKPLKIMIIPIKSAEFTFIIPTIC